MLPPSSAYNVVIFQKIRRAASDLAMPFVTNSMSDESC